jgi:hypothetical protein
MIQQQTDCEPSPVWILCLTVLYLSADSPNFGPDSEVHGGLDRLPHRVQSSRLDVTSGCNTQIPKPADRE